MQPSEQGYKPVPGLLAKQLAEVTELRDPTMPDYEIIEAETLLDSSDMKPADWQNLGEQIVAVYDQFDGFVIVHGTDTMAYTTSALSFMLRGLEKPVIFTGSQIPLGFRRNDARENLITALILASEYVIPEVCLYFGGRLLRGNRATKLSTSSFTAFESPNSPPLGLVGTDINVFSHRLREPIETSFELKSIERQRIATFRLFPGVSADVLDNLLRHPIQALILESFGVGNGPTSSEFSEVLSRANDRGVIIVNCSQCTHGCIDMNDYATGKSLADAGVITGRDMTIEAAVTKIMFLLTHETNIESVKKKIADDLAGELTGLV